MHPIFNIKRLNSCGLDLDIRECQYFVSHFLHVKYYLLWNISFLAEERGEAEISNFLDAVFPCSFKSDMYILSIS